MRLLPATVMPRPAPNDLVGGTIHLDESPVNRGPNDLVGGDGLSVELTKARNQSWKPLGPLGVLWARSLQTIDEIRN